jgi:hypothetical protein
VPIIAIALFSRCTFADLSRNMSRASLTPAHVYWGQSDNICSGTLVIISLLPAPISAEPQPISFPPVDPGQSERIGSLRVIQDREILRGIFCEVASPIIRVICRCLKTCHVVGELRRCHFQAVHPKCVAIVLMEVVKIILADGLPNISCKVIFQC